MEQGTRAVNLGELAVMNSGVSEGKLSKKLTSPSPEEKIWSQLVACEMEYCNFVW